MTMINPLRDGRHYDALKTQDDIAFYQAYAQQATGPVLEIGCGTGRVTIPLAAAGVDITGLDVSSSMLAEAKRKAQQQSLEIRWVQADGRNFELGQRYTLILMPFNPCELDLLLEHHGFHSEEKLGNFDGSPFSDAAPKQIVICSPVP
jgi:SAM-dependent methyltransferase